MNPLKGIMLGALVSVIITTYFKGRMDGVQVQRARQAVATAKTETALASVSAALRRSESARLQTERIADDLQEQRDNEALSDIDAGRIAVSVDGVQRLNKAR